MFRSHFLEILVFAQFLHTSRRHFRFDFRFKCTMACTPLLLALKMVLNPSLAASHAQRYSRRAVALAFASSKWIRFPTVWFKRRTCTRQGGELSSEEAYICSRFSLQHPFQPPSSFSLHTTSSLEQCCAENTKTRCTGDFYGIICSVTPVGCGSLSTYRFGVKLILLFSVISTRIRIRYNPMHFYQAALTCSNGREMHQGFSSRYLLTCYVSCTHQRLGESCEVSKALGTRTAVPP